MPKISFTETGVILEQGSISLFDSKSYIYIVQEKKVDATAQTVFSLMDSAPKEGEILSLERLLERLKCATPDQFKTMEPILDRLILQEANAYNGMLGLTIRFGSNIKNVFIGNGFSTSHTRSLSLKEKVKTEAEKQFGKTVETLRAACKKNSLEEVRSILASGFNPQFIDQRKDTLLHWACEGDNWNVVSFLIEQGVPATTINQKACSPLHHACQTASYQVIDLLIKHGASLTQINTWGFTPFWQALVYGSDLWSEKGWIKEKFSFIWGKMRALTGAQRDSFLKKLEQAPETLASEEPTQTLFFIFLLGKPEMGTRLWQQISVPQREAASQFMNQLYPGIWTPFS